MKSFELTEEHINCSHSTSSSIRVIGSNCTCEVVVVVCDECGKYLSEPKTDC